MILKKGLLVRKEGWGKDFSSVLSSTSEKIGVVRSRRFRPHLLDGVTMVINWGFHDKEIPEDMPTLNNREAMSASSNKGRFRLSLQEAHPEIVPKTFSNTQDALSYLENTGPIIVRPNRHMQGINLHYCTNQRELENAIRLCGPSWYASAYIPKIAEYRVYIVQGKVFAVSQKMVENPEDVAWNHAGGGCEFVNVRWDDWPLSVVDAACRAFVVSQLDFGGVDVMVGGDGSAYVLETNSAISLPLLEDGESFEDRISYHQKAMIKCLEWAVDGKDPVYNYQGRKQHSYHHYIHAAMKDRG